MEKPENPFASWLFLVNQSDIDDGKFWAFLRDFSPFRLQIHFDFRLFTEKLFSINQQTTKFSLRLKKFFWVEVFLTNAKRKKENRSKKGEKALIGISRSLFSHYSRITFDYSRCSLLLLLFLWWEFEQDEQRRDVCKFTLMLFETDDWWGEKGRRWATNMW